MKSDVYIKYLRYSPKKLKELGKIVVGLSALEAIDRLSILSKKGKGFLSSAIKSAIANHVNNLKQDKKLLKVKSVEILKGPSFKRWQPVSRGMAHQIKKRTSHIKITLEENKVGAKILTERVESTEKTKKNQSTKEERSKDGTKG